MKEIWTTMASMMGVWAFCQSLLHTVFPPELRFASLKFLNRLFSYFSSYCYYDITEIDGVNTNELYNAVQLYLSSSASISGTRLSLTRGLNSSSITYGLSSNDRLVDTFAGATVEWEHVVTQRQSQTFSWRPMPEEKRGFTLRARKKNKHMVLTTYLDFVMERANELRRKNQDRLLYTNSRGGSLDSRGHPWESVPFKHPSTFDTLAMDPVKKAEIMADLSDFASGESFYQKTGRAWKRGYLLYGPPGTGKSSMIAAMANHLGYDIYDLELTEVNTNSELRKLLMKTSSKSIIVIEDIDCSINLTNRSNQNDKKKTSYDAAAAEDGGANTITLSGLLNFTDGLWSCCGSERIFVFTTNHIEKLDPALLRSAASFQPLAATADFQDIKMSKSDLEMEDAEKLPNDTGNNVQESKSKVVDANAESEGEKFSFSGDVSERENGEEDLNNCTSEEKENTKVHTEAEDQTNDKSKANEAGSVHEQISTTIKAEEPTDPIVEEQTDAGNGVIEQKDANGGIEKDMDDGNHVKENPNADDASKNPEIIVNLNPDDGEHVLLSEKTTENADAGIIKLPTNDAPQGQKVEPDEVRQVEDVEMKDAANLDKDTPVKDDLIEQRDGVDQTVVIAAKHDGEDVLLANQHEAVTPNSLVKHSSAKAGDYSGETFKTAYTQVTLPLMGESDDGTLEEQIAFMKELESFHREKSLDFKPPKFYQQPLNCLKLWRAVIRLGGYDTVTGQKLWRQVGESFHPPKTCTTVSWTFRIFYEKSLLEYERHKTLSGELQLPVPTPPEVSGVDGEGSGYQGSGPGRARRDAAARAMQGWHTQRQSGHGEVSEPIIKDKNLSNMAKREKNLKSIGSLKQKRPNEMDNSNKVARTEISKQLVTSVVDVGPPADWVKINVRQTKDCFEVYALVPGLLREEVRVQSDPAGRVVITGQPEQVDNPWGITPFKKVISLPTRIDPLETSAVVSLHGRLFVRVPFEPQSK